MAFVDIQFPPTISYGSSGGPAWNTSVVKLDNESTRRTSRWSLPRRPYSVQVDQCSRAELLALKNHFWAVQGATCGFRFKDWSDYSSVGGGATHLGSAVDPGDQWLGDGDGVAIDFQLRKHYIVSGATHTRNITKPVDGTVRVEIDGVEKVTGWTVNLTTGVVTFMVAPGNTLAVNAGFEFDVPCRFDEQTAEGGMQATAAEGTTFDMDTLGIIEIQDTAEQTGRFWYGGAERSTISAHKYLAWGDARAQSIVASAPNLNVYLPADYATVMPYGGPHFLILNDGANTFEVFSIAASVTTVAPGVAIMLSIFRSGGSPFWYFTQA